MSGAGKDRSSAAFETRAIHVGGEPDRETGAVMPPIYATSTFAQDSPGVTRGYDYTRSGNPELHAPRRDARVARRGRLRNGIRQAAWLPSRP